jgi:hypothetical protein
MMRSLTWSLSVLAVTKLQQYIYIYIPNIDNVSDYKIPTNMHTFFFKGDIDLLIITSVQYIICLRWYLVMLSYIN